MRYTEGHAVILKAIIYFTVPFLTPLAGLMSTAADANTQEWPSYLQIVACLLTGFIAGLVALRAYFDGSSKKWEDRQNGNYRIPPPHDALIAPPVVPAPATPVVLPVPAIVPVPPPQQASDPVAKVSP